MNVKLRLFAVVRQWAETDCLEMELTDRATVADLRRALVVRLPKLSQFGQHLRFAVNSEYADDTTLLSANSEIACIPPTSGG